MVNPVEDPMNEFEKLLSQSLPQEETFKKGKLITGRVVKVNDRFVYVDIGYKVEGIVPREELGEVEEGQEIQAVIVKLSSRLENPILSYRIVAEKKELEKIKKLQEEGKDVVVQIEKRTKGGFVVNLDGFSAFLPSSETGKKLSVGKPVRVRVIDISLVRGRPRIVVSHRAYVEEEREKRKRELLKSIRKGDIVEGKVIKIDPSKGITILVEGVLRAFLPKEELSWGRDRNPFNYAEIDEVIKAKVKKIPKERDFLIVSLKDLKENPWEKFIREKKQGDVVEARVIGTAQRGLILEVTDGVEGYVPEEEVCWSGDEPPQKGESVKAKILRIDNKKRRLLLSVRQAQPKPSERFLESNPPGTRVTGKVEKIEGARALIDLGVDSVKGIIYRSDLDWSKPKRVEDVLSVGEEREFLVLGTDGKFVKLGLKQMTENPWEAVKRNYSVGDVVELKIKELMPFGAFLELPEGVEGLLPLSEVLKGTPLKEGESCEVKIIDMSPEEGKITFSIKALVEEETAGQEEAVGEASSAGFKLGEVLRKKWKM